MLRPQNGRDHAPTFCAFWLGLNIIPFSLSSATNLICNLLIIRNYLYRKPKTENRRPKTENRKPKTENRIRALNTSFKRNPLY
ncbi:MAG: hypothetical protein FJ134_11225 [Deltaproteobacteria bacterium]|nr:hypothetical protein [Deltaproteobacteria bacterium]